MTTTPETSQTISANKIDRFKTIKNLVLTTLICSIMYDFFAKPGIHSLSRFVLKIISFGSDKLINLAYEGAAQEPYPVPALIILFVMSFIPFAFAQKQFLDLYFSRRMENRFQSKLDKFNQLSEGSENAKSRFLNKQLKIFGNLLLILYIIGFTLSWTIFSIVNQSTAIYRIFKTNLTICAPKITIQEEREILSSFASMKTKSDYIQIKTRIEDIANRNKIKIVNYDSW